MSKRRSAAVKASRRGDVREVGSRPRGSCTVHGVVSFSWTSVASRPTRGHRANAVIGRWRGRPYERILVFVLYMIERRRLFKRPPLSRHVRPCAALRCLLLSHLCFSWEMDAAMLTARPTNLVDVLTILPYASSNVLMRARVFNSRRRK